MTSIRAKTVSAAITGPVFPILTFFKKSGEIDENRINDYVEFLVAKGAKNLMCTVGTSRYDVMTTEEMKRVNELVVSASDNSANVIVTTPSYGPTSQAIEFAEHAQDIGADAILAVYPDRYYNSESIIEFFQLICRNTDIGVMIHEMPIRAGIACGKPSVQYSREILNRLFTLPNMVGLKEESGDTDHSSMINREFANDIAVIGGRGGMSGYWASYKDGQKAYLVGVGNFSPSTELTFYDLVQQGELSAAETILQEVEKPFFDFAVPNGWHITLKAAMYLCGLCEQYERAPMPHLPREQMEALEKVMNKLGFV